MRIQYRNGFLAICVTMFLLRAGAIAVAQQAFPPPPSAGQIPEFASDHEKQLYIQKRLLESYQTDDPVSRVALLREILTIDPTNQYAREDLPKAEAEIQRKLVEGRNTQARAAVLQLATAALAANDDGKLNEALLQLDEMLKANPGDKELESTRQRVKSSLDQRKARQQIEAAITQGRNALLQDDGAPLAAALRAVDDALKANPRHAGLESLKADIQARIQTQKTVRILKIVLVITAIVSVAGISLFLLLRKRKGMLEFADGDRAGEIFALDKPAIKIGALAEGNDLVLSDGKGRISRYHCEILREGRHYFIKDVSTNGTSVNEQYLEAGSPKVLRKGDRLSLAGEMTLIFRLR